MRTWAARFSRNVVLYVQTPANIKDIAPAHGSGGAHGTDGAKRAQTEPDTGSRGPPQPSRSNGIPSRAGVWIHRVLSYLLHRATELISLLELVDGSFVPVRHHKHPPCEHLHSKAIARLVAPLAAIC